MKSLKEYIIESEDSDVYVVYDNDGTIVSVFPDEAAAKKAVEDYNKQSVDNKATIKKEKKSSVEK